MLWQRRYGTVINKNEKVQMTRKPFAPLKRDNINQIQQGSFRTVHIDQQSLALVL